MPPLLPILAGPTASGKSALALRVAQELGLEIIGADSRQVYAALALTTAAPSAAELAQVRHHLVGHLDLRQPYSAGRFAQDARELLRLREAPRPFLPFLVCGGSGFYLRPLLDPVDADLRVDPALRERVRALAESLSPDEYRAEVLADDPEAAWIPAGDRHRLRRYHEIRLATGEPASRVLRERVLPRPLHPLIAVLEAPLDWLEGRIRARARAMLEEGMVEEVRRALAAAPREAAGLGVLGVAEVEGLLAGRLDAAACVEQLTLRTRQLARRQLTWLRGLERREALRRLDARRPVAELADELCGWWRQARTEAEEGAR